MDYTIARNGQQLGTATEAQLRAGISNGTYHPSDLVWTEGMADWKTAAETFGIAMAAPAPAGPSRPAPVAQMVQATPAVSGATSGLAITSLVLGICSFLCGALTGLPAIITGHIARSKIRNSHGAVGGSGMALAGLILGYLSFVLTALAVLAAFALPTLSKVQEKGNITKSINNARQIVVACKIYAADHNGTYPPDLEKLFTDGILADRKLLQVKIAPRSSAGVNEPEEGFEYFGARMTDSSPGSQILLMSKWGDKQGRHIVGHNDASVVLEVPSP